MRHSVASLRLSSLLAARVGAPTAVLGAQSGLAPNVRLPPFADATLPSADHEYERQF
jgi:hypothetical protein